MTDENNTKSIVDIIKELQRCNFDETSRSDNELWITSVCIRYGLDEKQTQCVIDHILSAKKMPKFIVMGHKRHGKDTLCEYLRDNYGVKFASSSYVALEHFLFDKIKDKFGYKNVDEAYNDRDNHRELYFNEISQFNIDNGLDALGKIIFEKNEGYCGIRSKKEFYALKEKGEFVISIFVDASERLELESGSSNELDKNDADIVITNNTTLEAFEEKIERVYQLIAK